MKEVARLRTEYQDVLIVETSSHGRLLALDGVVQITETDEFAYQEMLTHVPILAHGDARRVLIVGGGDGGVLRRVLAHSHVEQAIMVEIDGDVVRLVREHMPEIAGDSWGDPRAQVIIGDGLKFISAAQPESFDVIIVDSTDPVGAAEVLFTDMFYADCARALTRGGVVVNQAGVPFMQAAELQQTTRRRRTAFPYVTAYVAAVPTYVGGFMALGFAAKRSGLASLHADQIRSRASKSGVLGQTRYWSPELHVAAFQLPPYIEELVAAPS